MTDWPWPIRPVHTSMDGDTLFGLATGQVETPFLPVLVAGARAAALAVVQGRSPWRRDGMILGTGIDVIEVDRIQKAAAKASFYQGVFTQGEQAFLQAHGNAPCQMAGLFAAKER